MTPKLALFTLIFGAAGGLLFGWAAACIMRKLDFPDGLKHGLGRHRQRVQLRIVMSAMVFGGLLFAGVVSMPAWGLDLDLDAAETAKEVGRWSTEQVSVVMVGLAAIALFAVVGWVVVKKNELTADRRERPNGNGARDELQKQINELVKTTSGLASRDDLNLMERRLTDALKEHDRKNDDDFKEIKGRLSHLEKEDKK